MLTLVPAAALHLRQAARRLTIAGVVYRNDGVALRCTQHDEDLEILDGDLAGTYYTTTTITGSDVRSASDLSADNMEISGFLSDDLQVAGFTVADIEAGLFQNAPFETFLCQWDDPNAWQRVLRRGYLGEIKRTAEGTFQAEWRGMTQQLDQAVGETADETCDVVRYGDQRCGKDVDALEQAGAVSTAGSQRSFEVTLAAPAPGASDYWDIGELRFTSGGNTGYAKQIKTATGAGAIWQVELWESMPKEVLLGAAVILRPGCKRGFEDCQARDNVVNFRGHGRWMPGIPAIIRAP